MALNQRQALLKALPVRGAMLEWGAGGTTLWLRERLMTGQSLTTVEHDADWARKFGGDVDNWRMLYRPPTLAVGANATHFEECPAGLADYVCRPEATAADVILVDGVARSACIAWALAVAKAGARIFLHDATMARRGWYEWALRLPRIAAREAIPADEGEYPPDMLVITVQ